MELSQLAVVIIHSVTPMILETDSHTIGSDGTIHFWDKDARTRLKCE